MTARRDRLEALPPAEVLVDRLRRRRTARDAFVERVAGWLAGRGDPVVRLPADRAEIIALGVPCEVCEVLVTVDGQDGHIVEINGAGGERLGASIVARHPPEPVFGD